MIRRHERNVAGRISKLFLFFSRHYRNDRQPLVLLLPSTRGKDLKCDDSRKRINSIEELNVRTLVGGKNRRAELKSSHTTQDRLQVAKSEHRKEIQKSIVRMAVDIALGGLSEKRGCLILDIGCGGDMTSMFSAIKGAHFIVGLDNVVNETMTSVYGQHFDVVEGDMSKTLPLRYGMFDAVVSVSALQWLFVSQVSCQSLEFYFRSLYATLRRAGTAALQFYPRNPQDVQNVLLAADVYFKGALIADYPHKDRGKKLFLYLIKS